MKQRPLHNLFVAILSCCAYWLLRIWFSTCRVKEYGSEDRQAAFAVRGSIIAIFWHYSLAYVFYHLRRDQAAVLVSASEDGDYIAALARWLDFKPIRGSRNRRGMRALKELLDCLKNGENIGIVADGSQGPAMEVQSGAVLLASKTGTPIVPVAWSASNCIIFNSWDRTAIPKPFSSIKFFYGRPFIVPPGLDSEEVESYRLKLQEELSELYSSAWLKYGKERH